MPKLDGELLDKEQKVSRHTRSFLQGFHGHCGTGWCRRSNMRKAIKNTHVFLNFDISPGLILIPSDLMILRNLLQDLVMRLLHGW
jgi:hypothetical protein